MLIDALVFRALKPRVLWNTAEGGGAGGDVTADTGASKGGEEGGDALEAVFGGDTAEGDDAADTDAQGEKPDGEEAKGDEGKDADGATEEDAVPEGAYVFELGEGRELDPVLVEKFSPVLKEIGLGQKAANRLAGVLDEALQAQVDADVDAAVAQTKAWRTEAKADPEIGQGNWDTATRAANKALQRFGTAGLTEVLKATGLGNHPEVIRYFARVEKAFGDDTIDPGNATNSAKDLPIEQRWYGAKK